MKPFTTNTRTASIQVASMSLAASATSNHLNPFGQQQRCSLPVSPAEKRQTILQIIDSALNLLEDEDFEEDF